jgi:hypothetical protein
MYSNNPGNVPYPSSPRPETSLVVSAAAIHPKSEFILNVKKWNLLETEIKRYNDRLKQMRSMKSGLADSICSYISESGMNRATKIEVSDGEIRVVERQEYSAITFSYIESCLQDIIPDKRSIDAILEHLKASRTKKSVVELKKIGHTKRDADA